MFNLVALFLLALPAWVANAVPVMLGGGPKVDGGAKAWDGHRWLGDSKTINGLVNGIAFGSAVGAIVAAGFGSLYLPGLTVSEKVAFAVMMATGAMLGDLLGSFVKRRRGMKPGHPSRVLDKLLFLFVALALGWLVYPDLWHSLGWEGITALTIITYALHMAFNWLAHSLKMKKVPW